MTSDAGAESGGQLSGSGGVPATGGLASVGSGGEALSEWDELLLTAGAPGIFSEDNFWASCRVEEVLGKTSECLDFYGAESEGQFICGHLAVSPPYFYWSDDPCMRTGALGACLIETPAKRRAHYYYDSTIFSVSLEENCELKGGSFYEL